MEGIRSYSITVDVPDYRIIMHSYDLSFMLLVWSL